MFKPKHATIHEFAESYPGSTVSSVAETWSLPENPEASPVFYPGASKAQIPDKDEQNGYISPSKISAGIAKIGAKSQETQEKEDELREKCSSRTEKCHCLCDVMFIIFFCYYFQMYVKFVYEHINFSDKMTF